MTRQILSFGLVTALAVAGCDEPFHKEHETFASVTKGLSEGEVRQKLGEPFRTHVADGPSAKSYYIDGYAREERPITGKVLIYMGTDAVAYIYFDRNDTVEHVFVGGS